MKRLIGEANWNALRPVLLWTFFVLIPVAFFAYKDYPFLNYVIDHKWAMSSFIWVLFSLFTGWAEAYYYNAKIWSNFDLKINEHIIWNCYRLFVWVTLWYMTDFLTAGALVLVFPFIHDGKYYSQRHKLYGAVYENRWLSNPSETSTAITDKFMNVFVRIGLFLVGIFILIYSNRYDLW